ncbi:glycoside hydrolase family 63 protein [Pleomassaria siparia CBS 279.74]|uniref:Mannosyl-oligosaccharide glucosidase n=1 Tax=Pleomassaria siparia CBS 279.74 TaxID=1314801 RepID=A0A6G1K999_9PLEO|nr:glycoside hydrolase family 63 protein [Pleomassaria siparia CBS 279.74]
MRVHTLPLVSAILLFRNTVPAEALWLNDTTTTTSDSAVPYKLDANTASLLWGPYRPGCYVGIRPRIPSSLTMGVMWGDNLRHTIGTNDSIAGWGWTTYDSRTGGSQTIHDVNNTIDITTEFVKKYEGQSAGNWALRVRGSPRKDAKSRLRTTVVFYVGMEKMSQCGDDCELLSWVEKKGQNDRIHVDSAEFKIKHPGLGLARISLPNPKGKDNARSSRTSVHNSTAVKAATVEEDMLWQSNTVYKNALNPGSEIRDKKNTMLANQPGIGNMHFVQMVFQDDFEFEVLYSSREARKQMTSSELTAAVESNRDAFNTMFTSVYRPSRPFNNESHVAFSQSILSNLLGGLSYFHGDMKVDGTRPELYSETNTEFWKDAEEARRHGRSQDKGPFELLSYVPSRSFFPRGFLWDEGFHLLLVVEWDLDLALEVVRSWLTLMDDDGWIAREIVLGPEARNKVPENFIVQYPHIANPPTLFWTVGKYIDMLSGKITYNGHNSIYLSQPETGAKLLAEIYPLLKRHYGWFRRTQSGDVGAYTIPDVTTEGYRWRGRAPGTNLASGLDDFPRVEPPDPTELHIDALCWVGVMASTLSAIAHYTKSADDSVFQQQFADIVRNMDTVHWSEKEDMYCDTLVFMDRHTHTCLPGYVSLFPFMMGFMDPDHPHLNATLNLLRDPEELWSLHGIRSLSRSSAQYRTKDDYWRSPIWLNINYLIVEQLLRLGTTSGPLQQRCKEIYTELRENLVRTTYASWLETGFVWEQYNSGTGKGQRTKGFTGWTSLLTKMMAFPDLEPGKIKDGNGYDRSGGYMEVGAERGWGAGLVAIAVVVFGILYVMRRRFARLSQILMASGGVRRFSIL